MGVFNRMWSWLGLGDEEVVREEYVSLPGNVEDSQKSVPNVVSIHSNKTMKVIVCEPDSFDEVQGLADHLKSRKQLILNFENTRPDEARRILDFISGTTYSLDGNSQQLGKNVFAFVPNNVEIAKDNCALIRKPGLVNPFGGER